MILVDSSLWIQQARGGLQVSEFVPPQLIATCPPVVQEVLQGIQHDAVYDKARDTFFSLHILEDPMDVQVFDDAAELYRLGRKVGYTIRSSYDCLIAAVAIRNRVPVLHSDRDFDTLARFSSLRARNVMQ